MWTNFKKKAAVTLSLGALLLVTIPTPSVAKPAKPRPTPADTGYQQAKKDLPNNMYVLYRVIDRLARANELDQKPWRVVLVPKYQINAFATEANLIAVYTGIIDQLAGDSSALACIVGHEMSHHTKRHIAIKSEQELALFEQAKLEVEEESKDAETQANVEDTTNNVIRNVGNNVLGNIDDNLLRNVGGSIFGGIFGGRRSSATERQQEIVAKKEAELAERIAAATRIQEYEADQQGYLYAARAGFEPEGCIRAMNVLNQLPGTTRDTSHPAVPKRIEALTALMKKNPPQSLAAEGKVRITATKPLTYDRSEDGVSLRINSRNGGSFADDLERQFGQ